MRSKDGAQEGQMHIPFSYSGGGLRRLYLDTSIYTAAIVSPLALGSEGLDFSADGMISTMMFAVTPYACLLLNYILQAGSVYYLHVMNSGAHADYCGVEEYLQFICLFVYNCMIFQEIGKTWTMASWTKNFPSPGGNTELSYRFKNGEWQFSSSMGTVYKIFVIIFIVTPKFVLCICMLFIGGTFIVQANENSEIFLNAMSVSWVLNIDQILYHTCTDTLVQKTIQDMPPIIQRISWQSAFRTGNTNQMTEELNPSEFTDSTRPPQVANSNQPPIPSRTSGTIHLCTMVLGPIFSIVAIFVVIKVQQQFCNGKYFPGGMPSMAPTAAPEMSFP